MDSSILTPIYANTPMLYRAHLLLPTVDTPFRDYSSRTRPPPVMSVFVSLLQECSETLLSVPPHSYQRLNYLMSYISHVRSRMQFDVAVLHETRVRSSLMLATSWPFSSYSRSYPVSKFVLPAICISGCNKVGSNEEH